MSRPYGVALLVAGVDKDGTPHLFHTDPSGTFNEYQAKSIGVGSEGAMSELHEQYSHELSLEQAEDLALSILKHVMEEALNGFDKGTAVLEATRFYNAFESSEF